MGVKVKAWKGAWWVFTNHKGKRHARRAGRGPVGKHAAELAAAKIAARLADGGPYAVPETTPSPQLRDAGRLWIERYPALHSLRPGTVALRRHYLDAHVLPALGDTRLDAITRTVIEDFILAKRAPGGAVRGKALADETIKTGLLPVLRGVLDLAVSRGWLVANPLRAGEPLWRPAPRHAGPDASAPFTGDELPVILDAAETLAPEFALMLRVWAQSGLRSGELRGLTWADYDARAGTVSVQRSRTHARLGPPKTLRSQRVVTVTHPVCEGVPAWQPGASAPARGVLDALARRVPLDVSAPLFGSLAHPGQPMDEHELHRWWGRVLRRAGVRPRPAETLRHTFVSTLLSRGAPLLYVAAQTGHSATVMLKHYGRWIPQDAQPGATPAQPAVGLSRANVAGSQAKLPFAD